MVQLSCSEVELRKLGAVEYEYLWLKESAKHGA